MRRGVILSGLLHAAAIAIAVVGLPQSWQKIDVIAQPIPVQIVDISEITNLPKAAPEPVAEEKPQEAKKPEPEPEKEKVAPPREEPPEPEVAPPPPPPEPKPEVKEDPKPKPKPEPEAKPEQVAQVKDKPRRRPKPPKPDFTSVLKTVEDIRKHRKTTEKSEEKPRQTASAQSANNIPDQPLTLSELDAIRRQFISCWNVDPGTKDLAKMVVSVRVSLNPDRTVREAQLLDNVGAGDRYYRSFAESALRAVRNPRCSPVRLPPKKFEMMKTFILRFSAKEMLGL